MLSADRASSSITARLAAPAGPATTITGSILRCVSDFSCFRVFMKWEVDVLWLSGMS